MAQGNRLDRQPAGRAVHAGGVKPPAGTPRESRQFPLAFKAEVVLAILLVVRHRAPRLAVVLVLSLVLLVAQRNRHGAASQVSMGHIVVLIGATLATIGGSRVFAPGGPLCAARRVGARWWLPPLGRLVGLLCLIVPTVVCCLGGIGQSPRTWAGVVDGRRSLYLRRMLRCPDSRGNPPPGGLRRGRPWPPGSLVREHSPLGDRRRARKLACDPSAGRASVEHPATSLAGDSVASRERLAGSRAAPALAGGRCLRVCRGSRSSARHEHGGLTCL